MVPAAPRPPTGFDGFAVAREAWVLLVGNRAVLLLAIAAAALFVGGTVAVVLLAAAVTAPLLLTQQDAVGVATGLNLLVILVCLPIIVVVPFAAQVAGAAAAAEGRPLPIRQAIAAAFRRAVPLALLGIVVAMIVGVGFMLLIVPGFIAIAVLFVGAPACVIEKHGVFASLARSAGLTSGHRWRVFSPWFGIGLVVSILAALAEALLQALQFTLTYALLELVFLVLWNAWNANYVALTYLRLRTLQASNATSQ